MVCDSISSLLRAAYARQRGHLEANFPYRSRERRSRVWDRFRPVHLWMNAHFVGNLLGFFFSSSLQGRVLVFTGRTGTSSLYEWALRHLFVCRHLGCGKRNPGQRVLGRYPSTPTFPGALPIRLYFDFATPLQFLAKASWKSAGVRLPGSIVNLEGRV